MLQIEIVLGTASLIIGGGLLLAGSVVLAVVAVFFAATGYGLFFNIPTEPGVAWHWLVMKAETWGLAGRG